MLSKILPNNFLKIMSVNVMIFKILGGEDIYKMAARGTLKGVTVTMKKHPSCFKLNGELGPIFDQR